MLHGIRLQRLGMASVACSRVVPLILAHGKNLLLLSVLNLAVIMCRSTCLSEACAVAGWGIARHLCAGSHAHGRGGLAR